MVPVHGGCSIVIKLSGSPPKAGKLGGFCAPQGFNSGTYILRPAAAVFNQSSKCQALVGGSDAVPCSNNGEECGDDLQSLYESDTYNATT